MTSHRFLGGFHSPKVYLDYISRVFLVHFRFAKSFRASQDNRTTGGGLVGTFMPMGREYACSLNFLWSSDSE